jgi:hypothetical protein
MTTAAVAAVVGSGAIARQSRQLQTPMGIMEGFSTAAPTTHQF